MDVMYYSVDHFEDGVYTDNLGDYVFLEDARAFVEYLKTTYPNDDFKIGKVSKEYL